MRCFSVIELHFHLPISHLLGAFGGWDQICWRQRCCKPLCIRWQCQQCNQNSCHWCWFIRPKVLAFFMSPSTIVLPFFYQKFILIRLWREANGCSHSSGLSCPPENFVEDPFLQKAKELLSEGGLFIINLVSRSSSVREMVVSRLKAVRCVMPLWFPLHRTPKISKRNTIL